MISFKYGDKQFRDLINKADIKREGQTITYTLQDGLEIRCILEKFEKYYAARWVTYFKNTSNKNSELISELCDCDIDLPLEYDEQPKRMGLSVPKNTSKIVTMEGSNLAHDEFNSKNHYIRSGNLQCYSCTGGRSSQGVAPFFDINKGNHGYIAAIGWTGQWFSKFYRTDYDINVKSGIEAVSFILLPGEEIRTSSILIMEYKNGQDEGHNQFKRLLKEHFSIIGAKGRDEKPPLSIMSWGGVTSEQMIDRIGMFKKEGLKADYFWVDAGWYGASEIESPNEFIGDWMLNTGNWIVNKNDHPDGLRDVVKKAAENDMKFLLWFEPERVMKNTPTPSKYPERYFKIKSNNDTWILNLGNPQALEETFETLSAHITDLNIGYYRQDFNIDPLAFWRENDEPKRQGINEIKHIMGLYELWDRLLERFPHLMIDNCASGGRRLDIEMIKRSVALWRSDYQCVPDCDAETTQMHTYGISWWLPYSGTSAGIANSDLYAFRSTYSPALCIGYWAYAQMDVECDIEIVKNRIAEFRAVQDYLSCDYYQLIQHTADDSGWATSPGHNAPIITTVADDSGWNAMQFNRPEEGDGIIIAFRKSNSPFNSADVKLRNLQENAKYCLINADTKEEVEKTGSELMKYFKIEISNQRESRLYFYKRSV